MNKFVFLLILLLFQQVAFAEITTNVLNRVYRFKAGTQTGASFTLDINDGMYLVTAKHLLSDLVEGSQPQVFTGGEWKSIKSRAIFPSSDDVDIVAYKLSGQVNSRLPLGPLNEKVAISQTVYFVGYPHGLSSQGHLKSGSLIEIPFIKAGILSAIYAQKPDAVIMFVDGHNNPGFSGGPLVFRPASKKRFQVAGVVRGYIHEKLPIKKNDNTAEDKDTLITEGNAGIVVCYSIKHIVDAIEAENHLTNR